ncbi:MAG: hypothetical protein IIC60_12755 [Proteobacteria bacterium]|nr:hypothetical protein [Pseudomonadota bacterium]
MKEQRWDDSIENTAELFDTVPMLPKEEPAIEITAPSVQSQLTKLRRRIEERLDGKRIAHEYDYDEFDDLPESLQ